MLKPKPLHKGDTIGLVGISGCLKQPEENFPLMMEAIDAMGYKVIVADSCREKYGYLSGSDASRAEGLNRMFADDRVDAVVCMQGGYGAARMLDLVDFDVIRANPKILLGYSDITAIQTAIHRKVDMVTFYGPMPATCWVKFDEFTKNSMLRALTSTEPLGQMKNPENIQPRCIVPGRCEGQLVGGNLTLIASACGTPYALDATDKVLVLEDAGEYFSRLDSMLTQMRQAGMFERCAGVVLGRFADCYEMYEGYSLHMDEIVRDIIAPCGKPVMTDMFIGHSKPRMTIPLGAHCRMDTEAGTLEITEAALKE